MSRKKPTRRPAAPAGAGRALDSLQNLVAGLGDARDKRSFGRYVLPKVIDRAELAAMWRSNWLVRKIVAIPSSDMTREWVTFETAATPEKLDPLMQLEKQLGVRDKFQESLNWARLYGGSAILMHIDGQAPENPLDLKSIKRGARLVLHVLDRHRLTGNGQPPEQDPLQPNFGMLTHYRVANSQVDIHHSRLIFAHGAKLPWDEYVSNGGWHDSIVQAVYDAVSAYDTAHQGTASMFFEAVVDVLRVNGLADTLLTDDGTAMVQKRFQLAAMLKSFNRMLLLDAQDEYSQKTNSFSGVKDVMEKFMQAVCGAADIPATRLFGQSATGLNANGDNDIRNYYDGIKSRQESELRPGLERLYQVLFRAAIGEYPDDLVINFAPLWQLSEAEQATVEKTRADRDAIYLGQAVVTEAHVLKSLQERGTYPSITDQDVRLAEELSQAVEDPDADPDLVKGARTAPDPAQAETEPAES